MINIEEVLKKSETDPSGAINDVNARLSDLDELFDRVDNLIEEESIEQDFYDIIVSSIRSEQWTLDEVIDCIESGYEISPYEDSVDYFKLNDELINNMESDELITAKVKKLISKLY